MDRHLLASLIGVTVDSALPMETRTCLYTAAAYLASDEPTALAWGRVLIEHTAPEVPATAPEVPATTKTIHVTAMVEVHPYYDGGLPGSDACARYLANLATDCDLGADSPVHRVEELTETQRAALEHIVRRSDDETTIWDLDPAELDAVHLLDSLGLTLRRREAAHTEPSPRGRAWLEAHPREGGEPE